MFKNRNNFHPKKYSFNSYRNWNKQFNKQSKWKYIHRKRFYPTPKLISTIHNFSSKKMFNKNILLRLQFYKTINTNKIILLNRRSRFLMKYGVMLQHILKKRSYKELFLARLLVESIYIRVLNRKKISKNVTTLALKKLKFVQAEILTYIFSNKFIGLIHRYLLIKFYKTSLKVVKFILFDILHLPVKTLVYKIKKFNQQSPKLLKSFLTSFALKSRKYSTNYSLRSLPSRRARISYSGFPYRTCFQCFNYISFQVKSTNKFFNRRLIKKQKKIQAFYTIIFRHKKKKLRRFLKFVLRHTYEYIPFKNFKPQPVDFMIKGDQQFDLRQNYRHYKYRFFRLRWKKPFTWRERHYQKHHHAYTRGFICHRYFTFNNCAIHYTKQIIYQTNRKVYRKMWRQLILQQYYIKNKYIISNLAQSLLNIRFHNNHTTVWGSLLQDDIQLVDIYSPSYITNRILYEVDPTALNTDQLPHFYPRPYDTYNSFFIYQDLTSLKLIYFHHLLAQIYKYKYLHVFQLHSTFNTNKIKKLINAYFKFLLSFYRHIYNSKIAKNITNRKIELWFKKFKRLSVVLKGKHFAELAYSRVKKHYFISDPKITKVKHYIRRKKMLFKMRIILDQLFKWIYGQRNLVYLCGRALHKTGFTKINRFIILYRKQVKMKIL